MPNTPLGSPPSTWRTLLDEAGRDPAAQAQFAAEAQESLLEQEALERADRGTFAEYLAKALAPQAL